ncbi:SAM-dependent methyltransferase [Nocardia sp. 2]|uniref:S-adenosyl-L-methionine-dependent methyltransferase n=2 Tax=Nocardia acididurans TaxID=2802282 RepID=A0ABS1MBT3_9NOCA|nr:SAM-dependent methyltransferase [Nocardia acididurans]
MRAAETRRPDALFDDPFAETLVAATGAPAWQRIGRGEFAPDAGSAYARLGDLIVARTVYFDEYFQDALAEGVRQFVIVAAGLDARAYRLEWPSDATVFEIDLPKVLAFKAAALAGRVPAVDRREVVADLRQDWPKALLDKGFDTSRPTAWLAEGLLRYLPGDAQDQLFDEIAALSAPGSRVALNMSGKRTSAELHADDTRSRFMASQGISINVDTLWYPFEGRTHPADWFRDHGWTVHPGDLNALLAARGRRADELGTTEMTPHIILTAIRPGGDS